MKRPEKRRDTAAVDRAAEKADPDDIRIVESVCAGRVNDFALLVEKYKHYVARVVAKHVPQSMAAEISQEVFVSAFSSLGSYSRERPLRSWLAALAVRRAYDYWRKHYRRREIPASALSTDHEQWLEQAAAGEAWASSDRAERLRDSRELLHRALAQLSAEDRMLVSLIYLEGCTLSQTAELLGWTLVNVKVRNFRVRERLRKAIFSAINSEHDGYEN